MSSSFSFTLSYNFNSNFYPTLGLIETFPKQQNERNSYTCVRKQLTNKIITFADVFQLVQIKMQGLAKSHAL